MRKFIVPALAALSLGAIVAPAAAEEVTVVVPYHDLNLLNPAGVTQLEGRVRQAVKQVCGEVNRRNLIGVRYWDRCRKRALREANAQVAQVIERERTLALASMLDNNSRG